MGIFGALICHLLSPFSWRWPQPTSAQILGAVRRRDFARDANLFFCGGDGAEGEHIESRR
jgi:hypothetical protein